ncbi:MULTISPECIES: hypothetical protein [unclassified Streptomyces]|uniref:hypothetical protein n=1 Tax=unclassified Streptomyces TaxID=2593676 RepID=UPI00036CE033|nr:MULTISPECIES: hypothetical protein [unclassified Streptomyces]
MLGEKTQQTTDLTRPENVKKGEEVYDRITSGKCTDAAAELDAAYGRTAKRG